MRNNFFEGADFKNNQFKALLPNFYPPKYKQYIKEETELLKRKVKGADRILEAGVGIGRLIPELAPLVKEFVGIDTADMMLKQANEIANNYKNVEIKKLQIEELKANYPKSYFDYSLCVWNTLGNVDDEAKVLENLAFVTSKSIFISVYLKDTLLDRKNWYKSVGIKIKNVDEENEIFYSESGLKSKSYNFNDIKNIIKKLDLKIMDSKILAGVILWIEFSKSH